MARLFLFLFAVEIVLVALALISCISAEPGQVRSLPKFTWIVLIVLFPLVGSILYFLLGRPAKPRSAADKWRIGGGFPEPPRPSRPIAPDDDPEFLRKIDQQKKRKDDDMLKRWEEDLKRRDDDPAKKDPLNKDPRNTDKSSDDPSTSDG